MPPARPRAAGVRFPIKAQFAFSSLLDAARALKPYTTPPRWRAGSRRLYLHASGDILALSASTGDETASVPLPGAVDDGWCALAPDTLIKALTASKLGKTSTTTATVTLHGHDGRLALTVVDRPTIGLDTTLDGPPPAVTIYPAPAERPITVGPPSPTGTT